MLMRIAQHVLSNVLGLAMLVTAPLAPDLLPQGLRPNLDLPQIPVDAVMAHTSRMLRVVRQRMVLLTR